MIKALASSFFVSGRIKTTEAKAKELRPLVERWITAGRKPDLGRIRRLRRLFARRVVQKIIERAAGYRERPGGYTRIARLGPRRGDAAPMAVIEFV